MKNTSQIHQDLSCLRASIRKRRQHESLFRSVGVSVLLLALLVLVLLFLNLAWNGLPRIDLNFFSSFPSRFPEKAGIYSAWVGTLFVMLTTASVALPLGIAAGIYLEEYAKKNWFTHLLELNITNLAAVPSIIFGLMALSIFVYAFGFGESILTAGLTLGLLVLPIVIVATREALRAVPQALREASFALGATKWQTVRDHLLPSSMSGIMTGVIISMSRAIGETAPIITIGALTFIAFLPEAPITSEFPFVSVAWLKDPFTVLPIQMFNWVSRPQEDFHVNAAAAGVVLFVLTIAMNTVAVWIRYRYRKASR